MSTEIEKKIANEKIAACLALATRALKEAEEIAKDAGVDFAWTSPDGTHNSFNGTKDWDESACTIGDDDNSRWNNSNCY
jgi:hypothetical protein